MKLTKEERDIELDATLATRVSLEDLEDLRGRNISVRIGEKRITLGRITRIHVHSRGDDKKRAIARDRKARRK